MGINIRYNSQNDDGSTKRLQLVEDEEFDSESKVEKQYLPVHFFHDLFEAAIVGSGVIRYPWDEEHPETDLGRIRKGAKHIPYLVMHGTEDRAVPFKDAKEFVETLKREGFDVTFEVYEGAGHGNYDPSAAIMNWLMHYGL